MYFAVSQWGNVENHRLRYAGGAATFYLRNAIWVGDSPCVSKATRQITLWPIFAITIKARVKPAMGAFVNSLWLSTPISEHFSLSVPERRITGFIHKRSTPV